MDMASGTIKLRMEDTYAPFKAELEISIRKASLIKPLVLLFFLLGAFQYLQIHLRL